MKRALQALVCLVVCLWALAPVQAAAPLDNPLLLAGSAAEAEFGQQLHQELLAGDGTGEAVEYPRAQAVFERLVPVARAARDNIIYTLTVLADDEPSAFALPGGFVYATTGLLAVLDDAQLAGVLAHELVHTVYSHSLLQVSLMASLERLAAGLVTGDRSNSAPTGSTAGTNHPATGVPTASAPAAGGETVALLVDIGRLLLSLSYSRSQEAEADRVGQRWVFEAGFDPLGLPQALRIIDGTPSSGGLTAYLSTHPATDQRIAALETAAAQLASSSAPGFPEAAAKSAPPAPPAASTNRWIALVALVATVLVQTLQSAI